MSHMSAAPSSSDQNRTAYLASNPIAVGAPGDSGEFRREYERFGRLLPQRAPLRVLDVGCGTGALERALGSRALRGHRRGLRR